MGVAMQREPQSQSDSDSDSVNVLVRNVLLMDPANEGQDTLVQLLIEDGVLKLVTRDKVASDVADLVINAQRGVLLGDLNLGEPPTFLVLSGDPRKSFQVLLDTDRYTVLAVHQGKVVRNRLRQVPEPAQEDEEPKRSGWFAYIPPPISLPSSYRNRRKWNRWDTEYVSGVFQGVLALDRQNWVGQDDVSRAQVGDLEEFDHGAIRALRFGSVGTLNFPDPWTYTFFATTHAFDRGFDSTQTDNLSVLDMRVDIPAPAGTVLSLGKQKEPISMERTMSLLYLPMQERSAVADGMLPSRNVGAVLSGTGLGQDVSWAAGAFNNWLEDGGTFSDSASQFVGRLTWVPWTSAGESSLLHLGLGLRYGDANQGLAYITRPEFNNSPAFVNTGLLEANYSSTYDVEASWRQGPFWLAGEYIWSDIDSPSLGNPRFSGHHLTASWALSGEMREYNRKSGIFSPLPITRSVRENGWGAWEAAARWSTLDTNDGLVHGGELGIYSVGLTWWLTPTFNVSVNYRWIDLDEGLGEQAYTNGFATRIVLMLD